MNCKKNKYFDTGDCGEVLVFFKDFVHKCITLCIIIIKCFVSHLMTNVIINIKSDISISFLKFLIIFFLS